MWRLTWQALSGRPYVEGASGQVYVWAWLDDGTTRYLNVEDGLAVTLSTNVSGSLNLAASAAGTSDFKATVGGDRCARHVILHSLDARAF